MAKKPTPATTTTLSFRDLVLGADADTLRQALEARVRIDELITERQAAYERIAALETQVEDVLGETGVFPFPAPPLPVAGIDPKADALTRAGGVSGSGSAAVAPVKKSAGRPARSAVPEPVEDEDDTGAAGPSSTARRSPRRDSPDEEDTEDERQENDVGDRAAEDEEAT